MLSEELKREKGINFIHIVWFGGAVSKNLFYHQGNKIMGFFLLIWCLMLKLKPHLVIYWIELRNLSGRKREVGIKQWGSVLLGCRGKVGIWIAAMTFSVSLCPFTLSMCTVLLLGVYLCKGWNWLWRFCCGFFKVFREYSLDAMCAYRHSICCYSLVT